MVPNHQPGLVYGSDPSIPKIVPGSRPVPGRFPAGSRPVPGASASEVINWIHQMWPTKTSREITAPKAKPSLGDHPGPVRSTEVA